MLMGIIDTGRLISVAQ